MREKEFLPLVSERLGIEHLNDMQKRMLQLATESHDIILLSPTGSGKTLAFVLPMLKLLNQPNGRIQAIVIAPSRELVVQIYSVIRQLAKNYKVTPLYGGHNVEDEVNSLKIVPDIVVATPGRLLDHIQRHNLEALPCRILVLDEFDKSLEFGFEADMEKIFKRLRNVSHTILTSATEITQFPDFVKLDVPVRISYLEKNKDLRDRMRIHRVESDGRDKLKTLLCLLNNIRSKEKSDRLHREIVFVNHRESADRVASFLKKEGADVVLYHGALTQIDREKAVAQFNNGSKPILVATDLAARGLDIESVGDIIHYHLPVSRDTYIHRNGRTARVDSSGDIYVITGPDEDLPEFIECDDVRQLDPQAEGDLKSGLTTLHVSAGRKEKISKGDIVGFLIMQGGLESGDIGQIDVYDHYTLVTVPEKHYAGILKNIEGKKIKGIKCRISEAK